MRLRSTAVRGLSIVAGALAATSCSSFRSSVTPAIAPQGQAYAESRGAKGEVDWPTIAFDVQRTGFNPYEKALTKQNVQNLTLQWTYPIGAAHSDTQPIVAANVKLGRGDGTADIVYVGDGAGDFAAVNAVTGQAIWTKKLGAVKSAPGCGNSSLGITSAPVIDRTTNRIYVLDGTGVLHALNLGTGAVASGFPPKGVFSNPGVNHTWSGLLLSPDASTVYFPTASHCDEGTYYGSINGVNTSTGAVTRFNTVAEQSGVYGDGVWSWGGESIDPDTGNLFAGVGNSLGSMGESGEWSDSIIEITNAAAGMQFVVDEQPENDLEKDWDIGATPVLYDNGGKCLAVGRKDGYFFTIDRTDLQNLQYASKLKVRGPLLTPAYSPVENALYLNSPSGITKVALGPNCTASIVWQKPVSTQGFSLATVANDVVYSAGGTTLYASDAAAGTLLWSTTLPADVIAGPTVVNGRVYITAWNGDLYMYALPAEARKGVASGASR